MNNAKQRKNILAIFDIYQIKFFVTGERVTNYLDFYDNSRCMLYIENFDLLHMKNPKEFKHFTYICTTHVTKRFFSICIYSAADTEIVCYESVVLLRYNFIYLLNTNESWLQLLVKNT